jgi:hypothetical protein
MYGVSEYAVFLYVKFGRSCVYLAASFEALCPQGVAAHHFFKMLANPPKQTCLLMLHGSIVVCAVALVCVCVCVWVCGCVGVWVCGCGCGCGGVGVCVCVSCCVSHAAHNAVCNYCMHIQTKL